MATHRLSATERLRLTTINRMLARLCATHHEDCGCVMCEARLLTDPEDLAAEGWRVEGVRLAVEK